MPVNASADPIARASAPHRVTARRRQATSPNAASAHHIATPA